MRIEAAELVRKMRGGAQAWLVRAQDGSFYVVKFLENAQHRRVLVNEWLASHFLQHLQLCAAQPALVRVSDACLREAEGKGFHVQVGRETRKVSAGIHFGSRVPVNPETTAIYDYLPDSILERVSNRRHFQGLLAFDQWVSNADTRQAVYFRGRLREFLRDVSHPPSRLGFLAMMIDHGYAFQGPEWRLDDLPRQGTYPRPVVYAGIESWDDLEPWMSQIVHFPASVIDEALKAMPSSWFEPGDEAELESMLEQLLRRTQRVPDLVAACRQARPDLFPNWKVSVAGGRR